MAVKTGRAVPPRMLEPPPEVAQGLGMYMRAFWDIAADRPQGGRIPWATIRAWCEANNLVGDDAYDVHFLVGRMDSSYVEWSKQKNKKMSADKARIDDAKKDHRARAIATGVRR